MGNLYFKRYWSESRGDEYDAWGGAMYYFETDEEGCPVRQIEVYDNGMRLRYDNQHWSDQYEVLGDQALEVSEFESYQISQNEFEQVWVESAVLDQHR